jgi:hypothetical protein
MPYSHAIVDECGRLDCSRGGGEVRLEASHIGELAGLSGPGGSVPGLRTFVRMTLGPWTGKQASMPPSRMPSTKVL